MLRFQLQTAWQSLRRYPLLSSLIVLAVSLGLAAATSTLALVTRLGSDPVPNNSRRLHAVQIDAWEKSGWNDTFDAPDLLTYRDAMALLRQAPAEKQAPMWPVMQTLQPDSLEVLPSMAVGRATTRHFFSMFDLQFIEGGAWSAADDRDGTLSLVISEAFRGKVFGTALAVGKQIQLSGQRYTVSGVVAAPQRFIRAHDVSTGALRGLEPFFLPIETANRLELQTAGNTNCWRPSDSGWKGRIESECIWLNHWVELEDSAAVERYKQFVDGYARQQRALGRFERATDNNLVTPLLTFLHSQKVVSDDQRLASYVGLGFLLVALINAACLLLAKFLRGARESAVHRALGASRAMVFRQHLLESLLIGLASAVGAVAVSLLVLFGIRRFDTDLSEIAQLDLKLLAILTLMSLLGALLAGAFPAWRISRLAPAASLRSN